MAIKSIKLSNFKSFEKLDVKLGNFNVLIGANASGKSNFVKIIQFLRDIEDYGLDNAISLQGGIEYLRNIKIGTSKNLSLEIVSDEKYMGFMGRLKETEDLIAMETYETVYNFAMKFKNIKPKERVAGFAIARDRLSKKGHLVRLKRQKGGVYAQSKKMGQGQITVSKIDGKVNQDLQLSKQLSIKKEDIMLEPFHRELPLKAKTLLLEDAFPFISPLFTEISTYDFDPKLPKKATPITGKAELEEDGSNLAIVLKNILANAERKRKLSNLLRDLLPFLDDLEVEKFADKSLLFKLRENYCKNEYLPASMISDGTINMTALIVALYFEENTLIIIEEPERNIHPYLISKVVSMMKDASQNKQVIVTTHNPEIVKHADLQDILLVSRDKEGFSTISRPYEKEEVKLFLKNEMGIEELYVKNLLELGV